MKCLDLITEQVQANPVFNKMLEILEQEIFIHAVIER